MVPPPTLPRYARLAILAAAAWGGRSDRFLLTVSRRYAIQPDVVRAAYRLFVAPR